MSLWELKFDEYKKEKEIHQKKETVNEQKDQPVLSTIKGEEYFEDELTNKFYEEFCQNLHEEFTFPITEMEIKQMDNLSVTTTQAYEFIQTEFLFSKKESENNESKTRDNEQLKSDSKEVHENKKLEKKEIKEEKSFLKSPPLTDSLFKVKAKFEGRNITFYEDEIIPTSGYYDYLDGIEREINVCHFHTTSKCMFGAKCRYLHLKDEIIDKLLYGNPRNSHYFPLKRKRTYSYEENDYFPPKKRSKQLDSPILPVLENDSPSTYALSPSLSPPTPKSPKKKKEEELPTLSQTSVLEEEEKKIYSIKSIRIQISGKIDNPITRKLKYSDIYSFLVVNWGEFFEDNQKIYFNKEEKIITKQPRYPNHNGSKVLLFEFKENELNFPFKKKNSYNPLYINIRNKRIYPQPHTTKSISHIQKSSTNKPFSFTLEKFNLIEDLSSKNKLIFFLNENTKIICEGTIADCC